MNPAWFNRIISVTWHYLRLFLQKVSLVKKSPNKRSGFKRVGEVSGQVRGCQTVARIELLVLCVCVCVFVCVYRLQPARNLQKFQK